MGRKSTIPEIEAKIGEPLGDFMRKMVHQYKKPIEIAEVLGVSKSKVYEFLDVFDLKALLKQKSKEIPSDTPGGELKIIMDNFIKAKSIGERSGETIKGYEQSFKQFLWWLENVRGEQPNLGAWNNLNLQDFFYYLRSETIRWGIDQKTVAQASTVLNYYKKFKALGFWMVKQELLLTNPIKKVETPQVKKRLPEDLPDEDIARLLNSFGDSWAEVRNKTLITLFLDTGVRMGGMAGLQVDRIDLDTGWGVVIEKGNKERKIKISSKALIQLKKWIELREPVARCKGLWINHDGTQMQQSTIGQMIGALNKRKVSEKRIHAHLFRHVWAKHMAESGVSLLALQIMGGWDTIALVQMYASAYTTERAWAEHEAASPISHIVE